MTHMHKHAHIAPDHIQWRICTNTHTHTLSRTSDQLVAETSTWQHTTLTTDKYPCPKGGSIPQSQQASCRKPIPLAARPLESAS